MNKNFNFLPSQYKKNNSKIIISGIGGDELFFGYPSFNLIPKMNKNIKLNLGYYKYRKQDSIAIWGADPLNKIF